MRMRNPFIANSLANISYMKKLKFKYTLLSLLGLLLAFTMQSASAQAETRTLNLYFPHTKESLKITYKKDGRYIPSAMRRLNLFFRDWRRNAVTKMDPKTIDLLWELYADLGAKKPAHIVSGYRSPKTNAMLRRIGRHVARRSQHMRGKAIDVYFPDIPISRLRGSAFVRRVGGVGYYPRSGKYGFVHIDSGSVRHWPRMSSSKIARIFKTYRNTIGARKYRRNSVATTMVATAASRKNNSSGRITRGPSNIVPKSIRKVAIASKPATPLPRPRPLAVAMAAAAADTMIIPASAPVPQKNFGVRRSLIHDNAIALINLPSSEVQRSNRSAKSSFAADIRSGKAKSLPLIRPLQTANAAASGESSNWPSLRLFSNSDELIRHNGAPRAFTSDETMSNEDKSALASMISMLTGNNSRPVSDQQSSASGKSDRLIVNRSAKSDMLTRNQLRRRMSSVSMTGSTARLAGNLEAVLRAPDKPIAFNQ